MNKKSENLEIILPKKQLRLFGYRDYFTSFANLYRKNKLPNVILLSGPKGLGKATFAYHFINYILSFSESNKYSVDEMTINPDCNSYKSLSNNTNSNFSLLESDMLDENIKVDKVREILSFLTKSTYASDIKIILKDNAEYLNAHSSNALLKCLEESGDRTFFFIIHNSQSKILDTIKSRCIQFKIFFTTDDKEKILRNIIKQYDALDLKSIDDSFFFDTPGNILRYLLIFKDSDINLYENKLECILYLIEKYKYKNDAELLTIISLFIELFYMDLSLKNNKNIDLCSANKFKLLSQINNARQFNLDKKNLFTSIIGTLENESK